MKRARRIAGLVTGVLGAFLATVAIVPEALAFPYRQNIGDTVVYSERPLAATMPSLLATADRLLRASPLNGPAYGRRIFLTDGGWRWRVLGLQSPGAFAFTRPLVEAIIVNRSDVGRDLVFNGAALAGTRSLSGVIAHERTHGLIRARYGLFADFAYPTWLREGYCDVVAGGCSLSDAEAAALKAQHRAVPALLYYDGRKRTEAALKANGGSVDALFKDAAINR